MKSLTLKGIWTGKKLLYHIFIILFSLLIVVVYNLVRPEIRNMEDQIYLFVLLIIQLELFFYIAYKIFKELQPGLTRKELTKTVLLRFSVFITICFIIALVISIFMIYVDSFLHRADALDSILRFFHNDFKTWVKETLGGLFFGAAVFIFVQWQDSLKREQKLREENLIFQNETLKSQVNPHFLFNNLNTLSSLIGTRPKDAELFILRLSSIYRYILENSIKNKVSLDSELTFIKDYFFLHKIRDGEKINLKVEVGATENMFILPVSLQILVENAIKHNMATREDPLNITVYIDGENIVVVNNLQRMATRLVSTGTGLKNLAERIRLISGGKLAIEETVNEFKVKIPLLK
jgi:two-component system LytT family sensor kinase